MQTDLKHGVREIALAAVCGAAFYLFAAAVFAVIVKAYAPPEAAVQGVNWAIKGIASLLFPLLFVRAGRALVKGAIAGAAGCILAMLLFAAVGGAFCLTPLFPLELLFTAVLGGLGALLGVKLRKEE